MMRAYEPHCSDRFALLQAHQGLFLFEPSRRGAGDSGQQGYRHMPLYIYIYQYFAVVRLLLSLKGPGLAIMSPDLPQAPSATRCGHEQMLSLQLKRIEELSDTLVALNVKFECVNNVNTKLEAQIKAHERRCQDYAVNNLRQLAVIKSLGEELQKAREREERLSEIIKGLAFDIQQNEEDENRADTL